MKKNVVLVLVFLILSVGAQNLVRNGSFESGIKYWLDADQNRVKEDESPHGFRYYEILESLFVMTLSRQPTKQEKESFLGLIGDSVKDSAVYEDIFWGLLNSTEFSFNH